MDRQTILLSAALFVLLGLAGFYVGFLMDQPAEQTEENRSFSTTLNVTADSENQIATANFDGQSLDLMHEDRPEAKFYFDLDQDGSFDIRLDDLQHDGAVHTRSEAVVLGSQNTTYRLDLRYHDDAEEEEDSWITLYRVSEQ